MTDTHRSKNPQSLILAEVNRIKAGDWSTSTEQTAATDAQRILEAMVAEYGVDAAIQALDNQGFQGKSMRYLLAPLFEIAISRRAIARRDPPASAGLTEARWRNE